MLQKNIDKLKRSKRATWVGFAPKITPTKKEKLRRIEKKYKNIKEDN